MKFKGAVVAGEDEESSSDDETVAPQQQQQQQSVVDSVPAVGGGGGGGGGSAADAGVVGGVSVVATVDGTEAAPTTVRAETTQETREISAAVSSTATSTTTANTQQSVIGSVTAGAATSTPTRRHSAAPNAKYKKLRSSNAQLAKHLGGREHALYKDIERDAVAVVNDNMAVVSRNVQTSVHGMHAAAESIDNVTHQLEFVEKMHTFLTRERARA